jgi:O-antigen/teichoic acid export membrane protein
LTVGLSVGLYYLIGFQGIIIGIALSSFPYIIRIYQGFKDSKIDFKLLKPRFRFMMTSYLTYLSDAFGGSIDKLIIAPLLGFALLGNYHLGLQFLNVLGIIPAIVYKYVLPHDATGNPNKKLKKITVIISVIIAITSIIISPILVPIIFPKYTEAVGVIQIVSLSLIPSTISLMYMSRFLGNEKNKIILIGAIFYLGIQVVSIIILGSIFGTNGAAAALDISAVSHMIYYIIADKVVKDRKK